MTALTEDRNTEFQPEGGLLEELMAAAKVYNGSLAHRNTSGYVKAGSDTAGEVFAGVTDHMVDNSAGAAGAKKVRLHRKGIFIFAATGLTQADVGKPLWTIDDQTVGRTPKNVYCGNLAYFISATEAPVDIEPAIKTSEAAILGLELRSPSNIETAAFTPAVNATWENYALVTALNLVLTTPILTSKAVHLRGMLEFINGEAAVNNAKYADGGTPDDDDKVIAFATAAAAASQFTHVDLVTDASGQIKIEVDDRTNLTMKFHLKSYCYVVNTATS